MTHTLVIGDLNVSTGNYLLIDEYSPTPGTGNGVVVDRFTLLVSGSSVSNLELNISAITAQFTRAYERRRTGAGSRVYAIITPDGTEDAYRSEIYSSSPNMMPGRVSIDPGWRSSNVWVTRKMARVTVDYERRAYWEDNTEYELTLENNSGSADDGLTLYSPTRTAATYTASTISFTEATREIFDADENLSDFDTGDIITVRGSANNDGTYTVASVSEDTLIINEDALTDESAGASISIWHVENYFDISDTISGDLKAPLRIEYENTYNTADGIEGLFAGMARGDVQDLPCILEGEDGTAGFLASKTIRTGASYSSGEYASYSWAVDSEQDIARWTLPASFVKASGGRYYKVILVATSGVYPFNQYARFRYRITTPSNYTVNKTPLMAGRQVNYNGIANVAAVDLGDVQIPPWYDDDDDPIEMLLIVTAEVTGGDDGGIDYVLLLPVTESRVYDYVSDRVEYEETLIDDGIKNQVRVSAADGNAGFFTPAGSPLMVQPGQSHRVFVQPNLAMGDYTTARTISVIASYRPRYSTV